jgi:hypothetical protein
MQNIYQYAALGLTIWLFVSIIYILVKTKRLFNEGSNVLPQIKGRQSTIHEIIQNFLPSNEDFIKVLIAQKRSGHPSQQSRQKYRSDKIKVVVVGDRAYWIQDNTFYQTVVTEDGEIDQSLAIPVDTTNMVQDDIDRLMLIVDDLRRVEEDDGSSSGNE